MLHYYYYFCDYYCCNQGGHNRIILDNFSGYGECQILICWIQIMTVVNSMFFVLGYYSLLPLILSLRFDVGYPSLQCCCLHRWYYIRLLFFLFFLFFIFFLCVFYFINWPCIRCRQCQIMIVGPYAKCMKMVLVYFWDFC